MSQQFWQEVQDQAPKALFAASPHLFRFRNRFGNGSGTPGVESGRFTKGGVRATGTHERSAHAGCVFSCVATHARRCRGESGGCANGKLTDNETTRRSLNVQAGLIAVYVPVNGKAL